MESNNNWYRYWEHRQSRPMRKIQGGNSLPYRTTLPNNVHRDAHLTS